MGGVPPGDPDQPRNVYALFPGIDTTPFGRHAAVDEHPSDHGWSAVPEPTIERQAGTRHQHLARHALWSSSAVVRRAAVGLGAVLMIAAGVASATALLPDHTGHRARQLAARGQTAPGDNVEASTRDAPRWVASSPNRGDAHVAIRHPAGAQHHALKRPRHHDARQTKRTAFHTATRTLHVTGGHGEAATSRSTPRTSETTVSRSPSVASTTSPRPNPSSAGAAAPAGPTRIGTISGGCNPKCS
jgi:hypothetical protein